VRLEQVLPEYDFDERHSVWIAAPAERVFEAVKAATPAEMPLVRVLFAIRSLPGRLGRGGGGLPPEKTRALYEQLTEFGFAVLADEPPQELVVGLIDQAWRLDGGETVQVEGADAFVAFEQPGFIKAAMNFRLSAEHGGTRLETQTRVRATDPRARRKFGRYWRVIKPGSGLVRRSWLAAVKRRAERG